MQRNNRLTDNHPVRRVERERGIALVTSLLIMALISALLMAFTTVVMSEQKYRFIDRDRAQAFYAASGGLEKLTTDLGNMFFANLAPTAAQVTALTASKPTIQDVTFTSSTAPQALAASSLSTYYCVSPKTIVTVGANGYTVTYCRDNVTGNPSTTTSAPIKSGAYEGLIALQTPYQLDVTARTASGGDAHLIRTVEGVAIPVFQFGMFSDVDLSFFAGPNFNFGGRVHTNGNLFLSQGNGATLTLTDKVTAVKEIVRQRLQNNASIDTAPAHAGVISMAYQANQFLPLERDEGSVTDGLAPITENEPKWHSVSLTKFNTWLRNGRTGAKKLDLPLITVGGTNPDLVRRAPVGEDVSNPVLMAERTFTRASLRILLSDTAAAITGLPGVTNTAPVLLDGDWLATPPNNGTAYNGGVVNVSHPPIARTIGPLATTVAAGSTTANIRVASTVPFLPIMTLVAQSVVCTVKDPGNNRFSGCNLTANQNFPATLTGRPGVSAPISANATTASQRIPMLAANLALFNPLPFWIGSELVTCTGWDATPQFTGCSGLAAAPAAGAVVSSMSLANANTGSIGGYIKIERQNASGVWSDITMEILNYGIGDKNVDGTDCGDPTPNALLRIQRWRDNGGNACNYNTDTTGARDATNWWPNVLFDTREGLLRDVDPGNTNVPLAGVMHYIAIDTRNLSRWFMASGAYAAGTGASSMKDNGGFTVYFSDRRNNKDALNRETSEFGWEDFVNPLSANGAPNNVLDQGEDVNSSLALDTYGGIPNYNGIYGTVPPGAVAPLDTAARPTTILSRGQAQTNRAIIFRHALKLINGSDIRAQGVNGLSIYAENPVYVQGDWNTTGGAFTYGTHAATSVAGDAVTLLSNAWTDNISFASPYNFNNRNRGTQTWYRLAIISGKGPAFSQPAGTATDFGTDGGAHNFLRYLENGDQAVNYMGSIATFFYNRQAVGTFKCCTTVYSAPARNYAFDVDFLSPALLPPLTPVFRDLNAVGFSQETRPGR